MISYKFNSVSCETSPVRRLETFSYKKHNTSVFQLEGKIS